MKILLLSQFIPPTVGGTEQHVWTLAKALATRDHDVTLLSFATDSEASRESTSEGVRVVKVQTAASRLPALYSDPSRPFALPLSDPMVRRAIERELSGNRFDIVHAHNWIVNSALRPVARARVPLVMTMHEYSHVCATVRFMEKGIRPCPGPRPLRCLSCAASHYGPVRGSVTVAANAWSARRRAERVAHVAAVSGAVADAITLDGSRWLGASLDTEVIPNFIPDELVLEDIPPASADAPLLFVGAIHPDKGVGTLLDAYRLLDAPPPLLLAGRAEPGNSWTLPDGVQMTGALPYDQVQNLFRSARAVVVPSVWAEPFGMVVLEAMAAGRPVIAAASGGIPEVVVDGVTGVLFPPGDSAALAAAIASVLTNSKDASAFGVAGRDRAREFTVSTVVKRIERMYSEVIADAKGGVDLVTHAGKNNAVNVTASSMNLPE